MKRFLGITCFLVACGGAAPAAESTTPAGAGATSAPEVSPQVQNTSPSDTRAFRVNAARGDLDRAESQVSAAMSDCAQACRALESMERAAEHLCEIDSGSECGRARERLEAAKQRVRASCGGCR